jgi:spore maturation protein SpmB
MCLFLAINTSGLALLPTGIIGLRAQFGSADPAAIFPTTLLATALSTGVGVLAAKGLSRLFPSPASDADFVPPVFSERGSNIRDLIPLAIFALSLVGLVVSVYSLGEAASVWIMPTLIFGMLLVGVVRGVPVYESFIEGAKEGFNLGIMIIPYLIAILTAIGMFRASGGLEVLVGMIEPLTSFIRLPGEVLPLALLRPLSGSGAFGITAELVQTYGADSYIGNLASTMNGSTETTFYVLAVYFGSVGVHRYRHALWAGLAADMTGVFASILAVQWLLGG